MDLNYPDVDKLWNFPTKAHIFRSANDVPNAIIAHAVPLPLQVHWLAGDSDDVYALRHTEFKAQRDDTVIETFRRLPTHPDHHKRRFTSCVRGINGELYLVLTDDDEDMCALYEKE